MSVKIVYQDIAPGADESSSVLTTGEDSRSTPALLPFGSGSDAEYATLEHNLWALDGAWTVRDNEPVSFWSEALTDANGNFETPPIININMGGQYTSLGVTISFRSDTWANRLIITWYKNGSVLDEKTFYPDSPEYFCENTVKAYDELKIVFYGTVMPFRRLRVDMILYGARRVFERDELRSGAATIVQEIDPISRELAANSLDWTLSSRDAVDYIFQFKQPVSAYDGDTLIGTFYITGSDRLAERLYDIVCTDAIGVLDEDAFPDSYYDSVNAYTLATSICAGFTVDMQSDLKAKTVKGVLTGQTRRRALQQLCFALGAVADTSGTDAIKIFTLPKNELKKIEANRTRTGGTVKTDPIVTAVKLTAHSYSTSQTTGAQEIEINGVKYYDTQTVATIKNPDATENDKANIVDISNATLISPDNVQEIAQHVFDRYTRRDVHKLKFRLDGEIMGDYVQTITPWETQITGHYTRGMIRLSGFALTDAEVIGA